MLVYMICLLSENTSEGKDAESFLNYLCGANLSVDIGKIVYTQFLIQKAV